jgi:hypothetical protein
MLLNNFLNIGYLDITVSATGVIGLAANTVDQAAMLSLSCTATNALLTLPVPTAGNGQVVFVYNAGADFYYLEGVSIRPGGLHQFVYLTGKWKSFSSMPVLQFVPIQFGAALTLTPAHHGHILEYTGVGNVNVTAPNSLPAGFQCSLTQGNTGTFNIVGSGGMVVNNRWGGSVSAGRWAKVGFEVRGANSGVISGDVV